MAPGTGTAPACTLFSAAAAAA
uniref:Uncharacterized protein n=1 Tax=Arundo donax TaxID=35708 RepID=A0A0A9EXT8_ARUDO